MASALVRLNTLHNGLLSLETVLVSGRRVSKAETIPIVQFFEGGVILNIFAGSSEFHAIDATASH